MTAKTAKPKATHLIIVSARFSSDITPPNARLLRIENYLTTLRHRCTIPKSKGPTKDKRRYFKARRPGVTATVHKTTVARRAHEFVEFRLVDCRFPVKATTIKATTNIDTIQNCTMK